MPLISGTLMRYAPDEQDPVATLASRVGRTACLRPLVPPPCSSQALSASYRGARAPAVAAPQVAPPTGPDDLAAAGTVKPAMALWLVALGHVLATRGWT